MKISFEKNIVLIIILAVVLRLVLAFTTFHADIRAFQLGGEIVAKGNILNLYDYIPALPDDSEIVRIFRDDYLIYPPVIYIYHGIFNFIFSSIGLGVVNDYLIENASTFGKLDFNLHLLLLKLPYLIPELLVSYFLYKLFDSKKDKMLALTLWLFNPITLYATYIMAQYDVIAVLFTVIALLFIKDKKIFWAALFLGIGAAFKIYPLLLLPALVVIPNKFADKLKILALGVIPYILVVLPYLSSQGYRSSALMAGQTLKSFFAQIPISGGESIILYPFLLIFLYIVFYYQKADLQNIWKRFLIILLTFFVFTHYHPQWFVWITPFFIIDLVYSKMKHILLIMLVLISFFGSLWFFESSLTVGIFAPIFPELYEQPNIWKILNINVDTILLRSLLQTLFASVATFYLIKYFIYTFPERQTSDS